MLLAVYNRWMYLAKMLYCAVVIIFGCTMLSSACQISISGYKGDLGSDQRLEQKILKIEYTMKTTLQRHGEMLKQILKRKCKGMK